MILSPVQAATLDYAWEFYQQNDQLPPLHVICENFGWASRQAAVDVMKALEKKGYVERNAVKKYRFTDQFRAEREEWPSAHVYFP